MLPSIARSPPTRGVRLARAVVVAAVALHLLAVVAYAAVLLGQTPEWRRFVPVGSAEEDDDLFAYARLPSRDGVRFHVAYAANGTLDRAGVFREADVPRLLAGEDVPPILAWERPQPVGRLAFDSPCDEACRQGDGLVVALFRGDAWHGRSNDTLFWTHTVVSEGDVAGARQTYATASASPYAGYSMDWRGPVGMAIVETPDVVLDAGRVALPVAWAALAVAAAGAVVWAVADRRAPRDETPGPAAPSGAGTTELLYLVRVGALYAESVRRTYLLTAFAVVAGPLLVMLVALPYVRDAVFKSLVMAEPWPSIVMFTSSAPALAGIGLLVWGVAYARVREDLARWRATSERFEEEVRRILGA